MSRPPYEMHTADDFFSHSALELTFRLLRNNNPGLADAIKNTLSHLHLAPYESHCGIHTGEMFFNVEIFESLTVHTIGRIVSALTELGEGALKKNDLPQEHINMLRNLIDEWVQLTEWILRHTTTEKIAYH